MRFAFVMITVLSGVAFADPPPPASSSATSATDPVPTPPTFTLQTALFVDTTPKPVPSLRIEASRIAEERWAEQWRYPEPGTLGGFDGTGIYFGNNRYRPRTARAAALNAGAMGATLLGEILLSSGSPLAGVGALAAGATLDAAAADVDRDAEARQQR